MTNRTAFITGASRGIGRACALALSEAGAKKADHHSTDDDKLGAGATGQVGRPAGSAASAGGDVAQLVDLTWRQQCMPCHGPLGRGGGQAGQRLGFPLNAARDAAEPDGT